MFIDRTNISAQAGNGGNGSDSYFRRTDKKLVPQGGDGGNGGSVIFRADENAAGLESFRYKSRLLADSGKHGGSGKKRGKNGADLIVLVPVGTRLFDKDRNLLIRDLISPGDEVVVVAGGKGGSGNQGGKQAHPGEKGASVNLQLTVRIQSDVFLVGLPNSGKSKLLNTLTRSHAKEEHYPFTTTSPQLGVWLDPDGEPITICELPSIYQSSHEGRGLGTDFLKHLQDAKLIIFLLDPVSQFATNLKEGLTILKNELANYDKELVNIPSVVAVNKIDLVEAKLKIKKEKFQPRVPVFYISALTQEGLEAMTAYLRKWKETN